MRSDEELKFNDEYWIKKLGDYYFAKYNPIRRDKLPVYYFNVQDDTVAVLMTNIYFATDFTAEEVHKWEIDNDIKIDLVMIPEWGGGGLFASKEIQEKYSFSFIPFKKMVTVLNAKRNRKNTVKFALDLQK